MVDTEKFESSIPGLPWGYQSLPWQEKTHSVRIINAHSLHLLQASTFSPKRSIVHTPPEPEVAQGAGVETPVLDDYDLTKANFKKNDGIRTPASIIFFRATINFHNSQHEKIFTRVAIMAKPFGGIDWIVP